MISSRRLARGPSPGKARSPIARRRNPTAGYLQAAAAAAAAREPSPPPLSAAAAARRGSSTHEPCEGGGGGPRPAETPQPACRFVRQSRRRNSAIAFMRNWVPAPKKQSPAPIMPPQTSATAQTWQKRVVPSCRPCPIGSAAVRGARDPCGAE